MPPTTQSLPSMATNTAVRKRRRPSSNTTGDYFRCNSSSGSGWWSSHWKRFLIVLLATMTCFRCCCDASSKLVDREILRVNGFEGNLRHLAPRPPLESPDKTVTAIDVTSAHQEVLQRPRNNRTLLWRNYTALSGYKGPMDEQFLGQISLVWLQADPPTPSAHTVMAYLYILMMAVGFTGNAFVLFMFLKCRSLRTPANTFVMNLAISDWLMMTKIPIIIYQSFLNGPALGAWGCQAYGFVGAFSGTLSISTLTAISVDRFNVIVYPLNPNRSTTHMKARLMIVFCWFYSLFFSGIPLLKIFSSYVPEGYLTCCSFDYLTDDVDARIFMFFYFVFAWCVPFTTIAYCYSHILFVVISAKSIQSNKQDKNKQELKVAIVVFSVIALWFVAWTPYAIVALLGISHNEHLLSPLGSMLPAFFAKGAALINPYVYAFTHPRFRMECKRMFLRKTCPRPANFTTSMATRVAETNIDACRRENSIDGSIDESVMD